LDSSGRFVAGLQPADIRIQLEHIKSPIQIQAITARVDTPIDMLILVDSSISQQRVLPESQKVASYFIDNVLNPGRDRVAVAEFASNISLRQDLSNNFKEAKRQIAQIKAQIPSGQIGSPAAAVGSVPVRQPNASGATTIWDSLKRASDAFSKADRPTARKVILLLSDGANTFGEVKSKDAIYALMRNNTPVYAVGIGDDYYGGLDEKTLIRLSRDANGIAYIPKAGLLDLSERVAAIEQAMRNFYDVVLNFSPGPEGGQILDLELQVRNLGLNRPQIIKPRGIVSSN
jgi:hypothetical protein